jgi:glycine/D-amino acid oxidase-like deaminating enzyme
LAALGKTCEHIDVQSMTELTGSRHYVSGLYRPGTLMLQSAGYIQGMAPGLAHTGVAMHPRSAVLGFMREDAIWRVGTDNGHIESFGIAGGRLMQLLSMPQ